MILTILGILLILFGTTVSIIFWIPPLFNKTKIKEITGKRYPLVYIVYIANGPMLIVVGLLLIIWPQIK